MDLVSDYEAFIIPLMARNSRRGGWRKIAPDDVRAHAHLTAQQAADQLGITYGTLRKYAAELGIKFARGPRRLEFGKRHDPRADQMAALYRDGKSLQEIGDRYGVTRERVRQLIAHYHGLDYRDGGAQVSSQRRKANRRERRDADCLARHGCTLDQWRELKRIGRKMMSAGATRDRTPLGAYRRHKANSARYGSLGCSTELNLWQWWTIWQKSGKWTERGHGSYWLARRDKSKPYSVKNAVVVPCKEAMLGRRVKVDTE